MEIKAMRIDDRLVHGQIITQWMRDSNAEMIVVVDDIVANNHMQQTIIKLAVPSGVGIEILSIDEASRIINDNNRNEKVLLIVRNPEAAFLLVKMGIRIDIINVGNISNSKSEVGRKKLLQYIFVEPRDVEYLKKLNSLGIKLEIRSIPTDKPVDAIDLLTRNGL